MKTTTSLARISTVKNSSKSRKIDGSYKVLGTYNIFLGKLHKILIIYNDLKTRAK